MSVREPWCGALRETVLAMSDPVAQRYTFAHYALGEPRLDSAAIAGSFASAGLMDGEEYDIVLAGWSENSHPRREA